MPRRSGPISEAGSTLRTGIRCVFLTCFEDDFRVFAELLRFGGIQMYRADTIEEADFLLTVTESTVLLTDTMFLDGTCDLAAEMIAAVHPAVSLILVSEEADNPCWERPLRRSVAVVEKPLRMNELRQAIRVAHEVAGETRRKAARLQSRRLRVGRSS